MDYSATFISARSLLLKAHIFLVFLLAKLVWLLPLFLLGHFRRSIASYVFSRPEKVSIHGLPTFVGQWLTSLSYHMISSNVVRDGYIKVNSSPKTWPPSDSDLISMAGWWKGICHSGLGQVSCLRIRPRKNWRDGQRTSHPALIQCRD